MYIFATLSCLAFTTLLQYRKYQVGSLCIYRIYKRLCLLYLFVIVVVYYHIVVILCVFALDIFICVHKMLEVASLTLICATRCIVHFH